MTVLAPRRVVVGGAHAALLDHPAGAELARLYVPPAQRGRGHGRALLAEVCALADAERLVLVAAAVPVPFGRQRPRLETAALVCWLRRAGFIPSGALLVRVPRVSMAVGHRHAG